MTEVIAYTIEIACPARTQTFMVFYRKWEDVIKATRNIVNKYAHRFGPLVAYENYNNEMQCNVEGVVTVFKADQLHVKIHAIIKNNPGIEFDIY